MFQLTGLLVLWFTRLQSSAVDVMLWQSSKIIPAAVASECDQEVNAESQDTFSHPCSKVIFNYTYLLDAACRCSTSPRGGAAALTIRDLHKGGFRNIATSGCYMKELVNILMEYKAKESDSWVCVWGGVESSEMFPLILQSFTPKTLVPSPGHFSTS